MDYKYEMSINIAYPSPTAPKSFKESKIEKSLKGAIEKFNIKFAGKKQLDIKTLNEKTILLELSAERDLTNPTREISAFSQILCKDKNEDWKNYSQKENRLFEIKLTNSSNNQSNEERKKQIIKNENNDFFVEFGEIILNSNDIKELEKYIEQFEKLVKMAKAKKELVNMSIN